MRTPVVVVTATLTVAILLTASLVIVTGTRGEDGAAPPAKPSVRIAPLKNAPSAISANPRP
jgi:hypothetical protein